MSLARHLSILDSGIEEHWMDRALKVAFATSDLKHVNQHFGSAETLVIYAVGPDQWHLVGVAQFGLQDQDGNESKLVAKIQALEGCAVLYCQAVGASAIQQLKARGVQPMKVPAGVPIPELLKTLRDDLREGPTPWLARILDGRAPKASGRFDLMEAEGWQE